MLVSPVDAGRETYILLPLVARFGRQPGHPRVLRSRGHTNAKVRVELDKLIRKAKLVLSGLSSSQYPSESEERMQCHSYS
jgi:hypothetical protein